ncbi:anthranilate synthase component I family protein [Sulfobacillus harzensis]|uniref:anthranilate synthase component I family protein n=1 Tax=Sulfobacillus harzensis TaxID=2729629 RepID=UPI001FACB5F5|nr:anthranilate synthase component I family protein [Sulfobacillus harzensis]
METLFERSGEQIWDDGNTEHVAVVRRYAVDQLTPISAYLRLRPLGAHTLLESVEGDDKIARFSFIAVGEWARLLESGGQGVLVSQKGTEVDADPLKLMRKQQERQRIAVPQTVELPFVGGAVGYFAYDWVRLLERLPRRHQARGPAWEWVWPKAVAAFDHRRQELTVIVETSRDQVDQGRARLEILVDALRQPLMLAEPQVRARTPVESTVEKDQYLAMVATAQEYIRAGDIFQVVLSQRMGARITGDPFNLYRRLRHVNPSPYLFYVDTPRRILAGASPEMLVRVEQGVAINRPIAGTRPRGRSAEEDARLWEDLLNDPKERAEHVMLVDLARNDLGRISEYGSVTVESFMQKELYSHVIHMVSEVQGKIAKGYDALDVLAASFPAGTLTGAPKVRAMEIIEELEPTARGAYGGVVGYWSHRGDLDACITIRTLEIEDDAAYVQAGGGIVADSDPATEYQESLNKAAAALKVLEPGEEEWL